MTLLSVYIHARVCNTRLIEQHIKMVLTIIILVATLTVIHIARSQFTPMIYIYIYIHTHIKSGLHSLPVTRQLTDTRTLIATKSSSYAVVAIKLSLLTRRLAADVPHPCRQQPLTQRRNDVMHSDVPTHPV